MSRVAAPADRRFRRAHVKPSHRRLNWRPLATWLAALLAVVVVLSYAVYRGGAVLAHLGTVNEISVRGNKRLSKGEVLAVHERASRREPADAPISISGGGA